MLGMSNSYTHLSDAVSLNLRRHDRPPSSSSSSAAAAGSAKDLPDMEIDAILDQNSIDSLRIHEFPGTWVSGPGSARQTQQQQQQQQLNSAGAPSQTSTKVEFTDANLAPMQFDDDDCDAAAEQLLNDTGSYPTSLPSSAGENHLLQHQQQQQQQFMSLDSRSSSSPDQPVLNGYNQRNSGSADEESNHMDDEDPQSKRKAQNRAAQRAFRERRERHVKELQAKLAEADQKIRELQSSNTRLQKELDWFQAENKILKETANADRERAAAATAAATAAAAAAASGRTGADSNHDRLMSASALPTEVTFPRFMSDESEKRHSEMIQPTESEKAFLAPSDIWDRLKTHPRSEQIEIEAIMKLLMNKVHCSGNGPVFKLSDVDDAIALVLLRIDQLSS
ncbi:hypothetical protein BZA70DRAFT_176657 [Myxozyma melibiosi]|uniref:BZIP domain-containing protein n=1 Tax=Myxozyma melibiosi TaxID=54550 RepID=A0ABR1F5Z0_9ASCO